MTIQPTLFAEPVRGRCPFCARIVTLEPLYARHWRCTVCRAGLLRD